MNVEYFLLAVLSVTGSGNPCSLSFLFAMTVSVEESWRDNKLLKVLYAYSKASCFFFGTFDPNHLSKKQFYPRWEDISVRVA